MNSGSGCPMRHAEGPRLGSDSSGSESFCENPVVMHCGGGRLRADGRRLGAGVGGCDTCGSACCGDALTGDLLTLVCNSMQAPSVAAHDMCRCECGRATCACYTQCQIACP